MPLLSILAASLIALPQLDARIQENYPASALRAGKSGAAYVRYWVDRSGKVYRCEGLQVFGDEVFRRAACEAYGRLKMKPASAADGAIAVGMMTTMIRYTITGGNGHAIRSLQQPADITLRPLDPTATHAPDFRLAVEVQTDGRVSHCEGLEDPAPELADRACADAVQRVWPIGTDEAGNVVPYVGSLLVRTEAASGS